MSALKGAQRFLEFDVEACVYYSMCQDTPRNSHSEPGGSVQTKVMSISVAVEATTNSNV